MAKKEPAVSWQVLLDDAHWEQEAKAPIPQEESERPQRRWHLPRRWLVVGLLSLVGLVLVGGFLLWQRAQRGLALMEGEIGKAVFLEATAQAQGNPRLAAALLDPRTDSGWQDGVVDGLMADTSAPPLPAVEEVEWGEGVALARLLLTDPDLPLPSQVTRFYRDSDAGWLRTAPDASFWGAAESWEGERFIFRFYQRDREAVLAAAPQVDAVYIQMRQSLALPPLPNHQIVVVRPDDRPLEFNFPSAELRQPSPHLLTLPVPVSHASALFRSLTIYLINELVRESFDRYGFGEGWMWSNLTESGLRNWLLLQSGVLTVDQKILFPWLLDAQAQVERNFPPGVAEECQLMDGLGVHLLLLSCTADIHASLPSRFSILRLSRLVTTYDFDFSRDANVSSVPSGPMWRAETRREIVAATTIFLYAVESYGIERFPALLEALGDQRSWAGALPAVYGVTADAFEEGWRGWLAAEFGVEE